MDNELAEKFGDIEKVRNFIFELNRIILENQVVKSLVFKRDKTDEFIINDNESFDAIIKLSTFSFYFRDVETATLILHLIYQFPEIFENELSFKNVVFYTSLNSGLKIKFV